MEGKGGKEKNEGPDLCALNAHSHAKKICFHHQRGVRGGLLYQKNDFIHIRAYDIQ